MIDSHHGWNKSYKPLSIGFFVSLICTLAAFLVKYSPFGRPFLFLVAIGVLGGLQTVFQAIYFFHLGLESRPRWNLGMFLFMALVVFLVIGGSIWIMYNLNYYTMM